jgi:hypothetical protein
MSVVEFVRLMVRIKVSSSSRTASAVETSSFCVLGGSFTLLVSGAGLDTTAQLFVGSVSVCPKQQCLCEFHRSFSFISMGEIAAHEAFVDFTVVWLGLRLARILSFPQG